MSVEGRKKKEKMCCWLSAGVSSFIAAYLLKDEIDEIYYIHIDDQHHDSLRFIHDCEKVLNKKVNIISSPVYKNVESVCRAVKLIKMGKSTPCTKMLKKRVRKEQYEYLNKEYSITYVWGMDVDEQKRADHIIEGMPDYKHRFPLIEKGLTKEGAHALCEKLNIKRPIMYDMGYNNNNCIGCLKGGLGYWNMIRRDFPEVFAARAKMERDLKMSIRPECYLDELDPQRGKIQEEIMPVCDIFCEITGGGIF